MPSLPRRGFLGAIAAALGGMLGFRKPVQAGIKSIGLDFKELAARHAEQVAAAGTQLPAVEGFNPKTDKILIVMGAVIPGTPDYIPRIGPAICGTNTPSFEKQPKPGVAYFQMYDDVHKLPEGRYPHYREFAMHSEVLIGTVDELVADFREKLEAGVHTKYQLDKPTGDTCTGERVVSQASQPKFHELSRQPGSLYGRGDGKAVTIPMNWVHKQTHPAITAFHKRRLSIYGIDVDTMNREEVTQQYWKSAWIKTSSDSWAQDQSAHRDMVASLAVVAPTWTAPTDSDIPLVS